MRASPVSIWCLPSATARGPEPQTWLRLQTATPCDPHRRLPPHALAVQLVRKPADKCNRCSIYPHRTNTTREIKLDRPHKCNGRGRKHQK